MVQDFLHQQYGVRVWGLGGHFSRASGEKKGRLELRTPSMLDRQGGLVIGNSVGVV